MCLIAIRQAPLGVEIGDLGVTKRERISLVVVVGAILGIRVVELEGDVVGELLAKTERDTPVLAMCSRFHDGQRVDAVGAARAQARAPGRTEEWVVAVGEAREEVRFGIVEGDGGAQVRYEHPLDSQAERRGARVAEVLVEDEHVRPERIARLRLGNEICLLYTSDAADERSSVDLGGRRI